MIAWENYTFSSENENRLNELCSKLRSEKPTDISKVWLELFNYTSPTADNIVSEMETDIPDLTPKEEEDLIHVIKEAIEENSILQETIFVGVSHNSLTRILLSIKSELTELGFCTFCKFIASWSDDALIENCLTSIVLPKLKEKPESSARVTFSVKELAISKPDTLCRIVLIPLLTDDSYQFVDVDFLTCVFPVLQPGQKDLLILSFSRKKNFRETDWQLLQSLLKNLSSNNVTVILDSVQTFSSQFATSQVFGRFLVDLCRNLDVFSNKELLLEAVGKHETLLKRQALKYLEAA